MMAGILIFIGVFILRSHLMDARLENLFKKERVKYGVQDTVLTLPIAAPPILPAPAPVAPASTASAPADNETPAPGNATDTNVIIGPVPPTAAPETNAPDNAVPLPTPETNGGPMHPSSTMNNPRPIFRTAFLSWPKRSSASRWIPPPPRNRRRPTPRKRTRHRPTKRRRPLRPPTPPPRTRPKRLPTLPRPTSRPRPPTFPHSRSLRPRPTPPARSPMPPPPGAAPSFSATTSSPVRASAPKTSTRCSQDVFEPEMKYLNDNGYHVVPLSDVRRFVKHEIGLPPNSVAITIDDGYKSAIVYAAPVLKKYGYPVDLFRLSRFHHRNRGQGRGELARSARAAGRRRRHRMPLDDPSAALSIGITETKGRLAQVARRRGIRRVADQRDRRGQGAPGTKTRQADQIFRLSLRRLQQAGRGQGHRRRLRGDFHRGRQSGPHHHQHPQHRPLHHHPAGRKEPSPPTCARARSASPRPIPRPAPPSAIRGPSSPPCSVTPASSIPIDRNRSARFRRGPPRFRSQDLDRPALSSARPDPAGGRRQHPGQGCRNRARPWWPTGISITSPPAPRPSRMNRFQPPPLPQRVQLASSPPKRTMPPRIAPRPRRTRRAFPRPPTRRLSARPTRLIVRLLRNSPLPSAGVKLRQAPGLSFDPVFPRRLPGRATQLSPQRRFTDQSPQRLLHRPGTGRDAKPLLPVPDEIEARRWAGPDR